MDGRTENYSCFQLYPQNHRTGSILEMGQWHKVFKPYIGSSPTWCIKFMVRILKHEHDLDRPNLDLIGKHESIIAKVEACHACMENPRVMLMNEILIPLTRSIIKGLDYLLVQTRAEKRSPCRDISEATGRIVLEAPLVGFLLKRKYVVCNRNKTRGDPSLIQTRISSNPLSSFS